MPAAGGANGPLYSFAGRPGPRLLVPEAIDPCEPRRRRIWEIGANLHCSIIGTCLTTSELRQIMSKMEVPGIHKETDHQLHGRAVILAGQRGIASKLLQKALDRRHRSAIGRFAKARNGDDVRALWDSSVRSADIPGAYWAVLTHPMTTEDLVCDVFGEVHMLSHLVGAANRADIRRLRDLEAEKAALEDKVARQQKRLRDAIVSRDATVAHLNEMLGRAMAAGQRDGSPGDRAHAPDRAATDNLVADLRRRLALETGRRERADRRLQEMTAERDAERRQRHALERLEQELRGELESAEFALVRLLPASRQGEEAVGDLGGATLLYVGGRAHQMGRMRELAEQWNAAFIHHDGGLEDRSGLLEAHVARADVTLFPVDCVSHNAVAVVKRLSRGAGKPYVALRSSGLTSFLAALRSIGEEKGVLEAAG